MAVALLRTASSRYAAFVTALVVLGTPVHADSLHAVLVVDTSATAFVALESETLFALRVGSRGFPVENRAAMIRERIRELAGDDLFTPDLLTLEEGETATDIMAEDRHIASVYEIEAMLLKTTRRDLAAQRLEAIRAAITRYREERDEETLVTGAIVAVAATIVLVLLIRLLSLVHGRLKTFFHGRLQFIRSRKWQFFRVEWLDRIVDFLLGGAKWALILILLYAYLQVVLTRFVWTRSVARSILDLTLEPLRVYAEALREYLPNFFFLLVLALITRYGLRFIGFFFREIESGLIVLPGFRPEWSSQTYKLVRVLILAFALVVAFPYIPGSSSPAFQGISIFLGVLVSLGSSSTISNIVAGFVLTYMGAFRIGDFVRVGETLGTVMAQGMLVTRLKTPKNVEVTIPNSNLLGVHLINYSTQARERSLILHTSVTIGYDAPWRQVHALLRKAAGMTPDILKDPEPFVLQRSLDDFYVSYQLNAYTENPGNQEKIYSDLHKNIQDAFNEFGVQIMSPNYIADRARPTVVPKDQWYPPPAPQPGDPHADS